MPGRCNFGRAAVFLPTMAAHYIHRSLGSLNRGPMLTVLILLLAAFAMAVFAVWLGTAGGPNEGKSELFYVVRIATTNTIEDPYA